MTTYHLTVDGMGCSNCAVRVGAALKEAGITVVSSEVGSVKVQSALAIDQLKKAISPILEDMGYMLIAAKAE